MVKSAGPNAITQVLSYFPERTHWLILDYFTRFSFHLKITNPRKQRLGSFRAMPKGGMPVIHINNDLGSYSFLLVFLHELAHLLVWKQFGRRVAPHGKEWKNAYLELTSPLMQGDFLPPGLNQGLEKYFQKTKASFQRDVQFQRCLHELDGNGQLLTLQDIPDNQTFHLKDGKQMVKIQRLRTRYKCYCPSNHRYYLVSPAAQIFVPENQ